MRDNSAKVHFSYLLGVAPCNFSLGARNSHGFGLVISQSHRMRDRGGTTPGPPPSSNYAGPPHGVPGWDGFATFFIAMAFSTLS